MTTESEHLLAQALQLDPEARAELASALFHSLEEPPDRDAEKAWAAEIQQCLDDITD